MREEFQQKLFNLFPRLYCQRHLPATVSCMGRGIDVGDGWFDILFKLSERLEDSFQFLPEGERHAAEKIGDYVAIQVKEKFGCYDEKTEVLTEAGWKAFSDVSKSDKFATLNSDDKLCYQPCEDIISYHYQGKMYKLRTRGVDLLVTPNHSLYVSKGDYFDGRYKPPKKVNYPFELVPPQKFFGRNKRFKKSASWEGREESTFVLPSWSYTDSLGRNYVKQKRIFNMDHWLEFLGWFISEGCASATKSERGEITISCNNTDGGIERKTVENIFEELDISYTTAMEDRSALVFKHYSKQMAMWLVEHCGHLAPNKKVPSFVKQLPPHQIRIFLRALYSGDGCRQQTSHILTTTSKQLANDVTELLLKIGDCGRIYNTRKARQSKLVKGKYPAFEINWLKHSYYHNTSNKGLAKNSTEEWVDYSGEVFCVTVPNHILYVRRNGKPVWCGNSLRFRLNKKTESMDKAIREAEEASLETCEECGQPGSPRYGDCVSTLCDNCWLDKPLKGD